MLRIRSTTKSMGQTALMVPVFLANRHAQLCHLVIQHEKFFRDGSSYFEIVGYIGFITGDMYVVEDDTEFFKKWVVDHREANIINDPGAFVLTAGIRKKEDLYVSGFFGSDVVKFATRATPNGVEFGFYNHEFYKFPNAPTNYLFASVGSNMLWNDPETFVEFLIRKGLDRDIERFLSGRNSTAKLQNLGGD